MDAQTFLSALREVTIYPEGIISLLRERAESLTPEVRGSIITDMRAAQKRERTILEEGSGEITAIERHIKGAKRKIEEEDEQKNIPSLDL